MKTMADWKIVVTLLIVLGVLAAFAGSAPGVTNFFGEVSGRFSGLFPGGADAPQNGGNAFSLVLNSYDEVRFRASGSAVALSGDANAIIDNGNIQLRDPKIAGFTGSGSISSVLALNGTADSVAFGPSRLGKTRLDMSSSPASLTIGNVSIQSIMQDNAQGELVLNGSITKFSGKLAMKSISGSLFFANGTLQIEGKAVFISIPGAGIKIG